METPVKDNICQRKENPMDSRCVMFIHIALMDCNRMREECDFTFLKHTLLCIDCSLRSFHSSFSSPVMDALH